MQAGLEIHVLLKAPRIDWLWTGIPKVSIGTTRIWLFDKLISLASTGIEMIYFLLVSLGLISAPHTLEKEWYGVL
jgi:hypothetical protein